MAVGTILNWVVLVGKMGYLEHRKILERQQRKGKYAPRQVGTDEIYFTMKADDKPLGISYLVDTETSTILDVYKFRGRNISNGDVYKLYKSNERYFGSVEVITTDGAKPYEYFVKLKDDVIHVVCIQHKTRNIRKTALVRRKIREKVLDEATNQAKHIGMVLLKLKEKFRKALNYILPRTLPKNVRDSITESSMRLFIDKEKQLLNEYQNRLRERLEAYEAYVHHHLYVSVQAALVGKLRMI